MSLIGLKIDTSFVLTNWPIDLKDICVPCWSVQGLLRRNERQKENKDGKINKKEAKKQVMEQARMKEFD